MTAVVAIVVALFGGLLWAGRRSHRTVYNYYDQDIVDVEAFCDDICDEACTAEDYQSETRCAAMIDRILYAAVALALARLFSCSTAISPRTCIAASTCGWLAIVGKRGYVPSVCC